MLVKCDGENGCGEEFGIKGFEVEKLGNGTEKTYFKCPHCGKEYIAFYTDKGIRMKQFKIRKLTSAKKINKLKKEIGNDMDNLRKRVEASTK